MNINMQDKSSIDNKNPDTQERNIKGKGKNSGRKKHLKPPRRAPRTYDEKVLYIKCFSFRTWNQDFIVFYKGVRIVFVFLCFWFSLFIYDVLQMRHYKAELAQYLASWKGLSMTPSVNIYDNTCPAFKEYLHAVYTSSNNKLSDLLHGKNGNEAFSKGHLEEMGWDMGV